MKILHLPYCFYPDPPGGTEVYVAALAKLLQENGTEVVIAAPGNDNRDYIHDGLRVRRYAVQQEISDLSDLYGEGDSVAAKEFGALLDAERPDIVHLHAYTPAVSLRTAREAKGRNIPVVFTYHSPTVSCQRGTMIHGSFPCDGVMEGQRCTACTLQSRGVPRLGAEILSRMSYPGFQRRKNSARTMAQDVMTALRMRNLIDQRHAATRAFFAEADHIVAVSQWVKDVLLNNGVPEKKLTLCRQGVFDPVAASALRGDSGSRSAEPIKRIAYFGRLNPTKGIHVLTKALATLRDDRISLDVFGVSQVETEKQHGLTAIAMAGGRAVLRPPVPAGEVVATLRNYDLLAVPSQLMETGPLVVWEAFAAGVPVLGSRLGGIAELVQDGVNGLLVEPASIDGWAAALQRIADEPELLPKLRASVAPPRTMSQVMQEMLRLYKSVLCQAKPRAGAQLVH